MHFTGNQHLRSRVSQRKNIRRQMHSCTHIAGTSRGHSPQRHKQRKRSGHDHDCSFKLRVEVVPPINAAPHALTFICRLRCSEMQPRNAPKTTLTASSQTFYKLAVFVERYVGIDSHQEVDERAAQEERHEHNTDSPVHASNRM
jgi:hypothetical protein